MKIGSTKVDKFREEKRTDFSALIANICPEKKGNNVKLKKRQTDKRKIA